MPIDVENLQLHITISDGEGTGNVGVSYHKPREASWVVQYTRWEVTSQIRKLWALQPDGTRKSTDITEVEAVGPLLALQT